MKTATVGALLRALLGAALGASLLAGCSQTSDGAALTGGDPRQGQRLLAYYGCGACHRIKGIANADSQVGPSLEKIREASYVGGVLPNSAGNLQKWIVHPRAFSPRTAMPELGVSPDEARHMAAYLYSQ